MTECPGIFHLAETGDGSLARLRIPGGVLTSHQLRIVADLSDELGNGQIDLTNRANLQIRGLRSDAGPELANRLRDAGLLSPRMAADRYRNITASPLSGDDPDALIDVAPHVHSLDEGLAVVDWIDFLSVKFSFVFDSGGSHSVASVPHDVGFFAEGIQGAAYYRISLAGTLTDFCVAPGAAARFALSFAKLVAHDEDGGGRMLPILRRDREEKVIRSVCEIAEDDVTRRRVEPIKTLPTEIPMPGIMVQRYSDDLSVGFGVPMQQLNSAMCKSLATLADVFGDGDVRLGPWFMVYLTDIAFENLEEVRSLAHAHGFLTEPEEGRIRVIACAGASGCHRTALDTKGDGAHLTQGLSYPVEESADAVVIHLSGCDQGCAFSGKADLLLLANEDGKGYSAYSDASVKDAATSEPRATDLRSDDIGPFVANFLRPS